AQPNRLRLPWPSEIVSIIDSGHDPSATARNYRRLQTQAPDGLRRRLTDGLLDLAFEQIRHYAVADAAVSLRLMRALGDIASTTSDPAIRRMLAQRGKLLLAGCEGKLQEADVKRLRRRLSLLKAGLALEDSTSSL
ncbi:MAG: hypothetical protein ACR650_10160, partial [Methylocystis sp.]